MNINLSATPRHIRLAILPAIIWTTFASAVHGQQAKTVGGESANDTSIRFATFNVSLYRDAEGALVTELKSGDSTAAQQIAEVIQIVRPDVLVLNEVDFDDDHLAMKLFAEEYLAVGQNGQQPIEYAYRFTAPVNTGIDTGLDLNGNDETGEPDDAFGFGRYPGQYGMVVLSRFPFDEKNIRTFQKFLWRDMPGASWPVTADDQSYYNDQMKSVFRLSSKSHWDIPVRIDDVVVHLIASHPTPPVFDGAEDHNGCRNHDEIRLIADLIDGADYLYDDQGRKGGLEAGALFVIAGDLNADPHDGASRNLAARQVCDHPLVNGQVIPKSKGGAAASKTSAGANESHAGDPATDTGDFNDRSVGNLRIDFVLPSKNLKVVDSGVFWPAPEEEHSELAAVSDHHLVWIDIAVPIQSANGER